MKKLEVEALKKLLKNNGIEPDTVDLKALIDETLSYEEAKHDIENYIQKKLKTKKEQQDIDILLMQAQEQQSRYILEEIQKKEEQAINEIQNRTSIDIDKYFNITHEYIHAVGQKRINSLVLIGEGGIGKSFSVFKKLNEMGYKLGQDYVYLSTYTTPLALYNFIFKNRDKVIIFDDVDNILNSPEQVSILKSALWNSTGYRTICWNSTSEKLEAPERFEFTGSVIICLNELPKSKSIQALLTRSIVQEISFDYYTKLKLMAEIAKIPYKDTTEEERKEVYDFIKENSSIVCKNINFRTLIMAFDLRKSNPANWKELVKNLIIEDKELAIVSELMKTGAPIKDQVKSFIEKTGLSRATYFRYKKKLEEQMKV